MTMFEHHLESGIAVTYLVDDHQRLVGICVSAGSDPARPPHASTLTVKEFANNVDPDVRSPWASSPKATTPRRFAPSGGGKPASVKPTKPAVSALPARTVAAHAATSFPNAIMGWSAVNAVLVGAPGHRFQWFAFVLVPSVIGVSNWVES